MSKSIYFRQRMVQILNFKDDPTCQIIIFKYIISNSLRQQLLITLFLHSSISYMHSSPQVEIKPNNRSFGPNNKVVCLTMCILVIVVAIFVGYFRVFNVFQNLKIQSQTKEPISKLTLSHLTKQVIRTSKKQQPIFVSMKVQSVRLLEDSSQSEEDNLRKYVLLLIIVFFVIVPATAFMIFIALAIYRKCTQVPEQDPSPNSPESEVQVSLDQYNIDQIGPYLINPNDQCTICLDNGVNVRTFCGHFFHARCIKTWYDKKHSDGHRPTCPVCVGHDTNPIKIYCKKCYISVKLDTIYCSTLLQSIEQMETFSCDVCKKSQNEKDSFSLQTEIPSNKKELDSVKSKQTQKNPKLEKYENKSERRKKKPQNTQKKSKEVDKDRKMDEIQLSNVKIRVDDLI